MKHRITGWAIVVASFTICDSAVAFDMNPIDVDCWGSVLACSAVGLTEKLKFPVHETITLLAYDYYLTPDHSKGGTANTSADQLRQSGILRDLVLGSEWNDDPDSLLRKNVTEALYWWALFKDAKQQAECDVSPTPPECKDKKIEANPMMLYRSHFGDLQFLHSMASSKVETAKETKARMMAWAKFTYEIYVSDESLESRRIDDGKTPSFADISRVINKAGWTVGALFDPVTTGKWVQSLFPLKYGHFESSGKPRQQNTYANEDDSISVRYIALGSLLHMVQDSYSDSHTARVGGCNPISRDKREVLAFRNYANQKAEDHSIADALPSWLKNGELATNNAIWASAHIINFAFAKKTWDDGVGKFLDEKVFPLKDPDAKPSSGNRKCFLGK